jgi:hypothetical protein
MGNLVTGMHPGIGPTGAHQIHRMIGNFCHSPVQLILDSPDTGLLELPAVKIPAIILKRESYPAIANGFIRRQCLRFLKQGIS